MMKTKLVSLLQVDITGQGEGAELPLPAQGETSLGLVLGILPDHIVTLGSEGDQELVDGAGLPGVPRLEQVVMLLKGHIGSLDIKVVNLLRNSLKQMVVDGGCDIRSNSAPESQVNGCVILLTEPGVSVGEVVGPQLAQVHKVSVNLFRLPGPHNLTEDVLPFLLQKAYPLIENGQLQRKHDNRSEINATVTVELCNKKTQSLTSCESQPLTHSPRSHWRGRRSVSWSSQRTLWGQMGQMGQNRVCKDGLN